MRVRRELGLGTIEGSVELVDADRELTVYAFRADGYEVSISEDIRDDSHLVWTVHADEPRIIWDVRRFPYCGLNYRLPASFDHVEEGGTLRLLEITVANEGSGFAQFPRWTF
ncbi:hypothetical protein ASF55_16480 [Methylobacterium sp. Leaf119]|nr:hypothetical protein ASF55_16480 [Methylobacterium sp. Leaf119]